MSIKKYMSVKKLTKEQLADLPQWSARFDARNWEKGVTSVSIMISFPASTIQDAVKIAEDEFEKLCGSETRPGFVLEGVRTSNGRY